LPTIKEEIGESGMESTQGERKHLGLAGLLWLGLTAVGEWLVFQVDPFPLQASAEGKLIDDAFVFLLQLAIPVMALVVAGMAYAILAFRSDDANQVGPPILTAGTVTWPWLIVTSGLAIFIVINPGLMGIRELSSGEPADLTVVVEAAQWQWTYSYVDYGFTLNDPEALVLPVDQRVRFEIESRDVIHSFWVPAFRMKLDAIPGQINTLYITPTYVGSFEDDFNLRVQCAEMCGTGHARMRTGVEVLAQPDFEAWAASQAGD
jgi:cytochrome c oxidase subunit 2